MPELRRPAPIAIFAGTALMACGVLVGLGSDRWITKSFSQQSEAQMEIWGGAIKPVVASEAEWLASRSRLQTAVAPGVTRIDLGPLEVIDVKPMPAGLELETAGPIANGPKVIVSARETNSGRIVRFIVEGGSSIPVPVVARRDGL